MTGTFFFFAAFAAVLIAAAAQDVWQRRIANVFPLLLMVLFAALVVWRGVSVSVLYNIDSFALIFTAGAFLFSRSILGGGDVKLLAAVALWFELSRLPVLILAVTLCGGAIAALFIARRLLLPVKAGGPGGLRRRSGTVPYGLAIAAGAIAVAWFYGPVFIEPSDAQNQYVPMEALMVPLN